MYYIANAVTDIGTVKKVNQDSLTLKTADSEWGMLCLAVICDGLGGLEQGEVASGSVIMAFDRWFREVFPKAKAEWTAEKLKTDWEKIVFSINGKIIEYGRTNRVQLGTTVTAALFVENQYYVIHVGDCRLYAISDRVTQLTKDQSVVAREVECGRMTPEEAAADSRKNVLLQCVGVNESLKPVFLSGEVTLGSMYLICSDGFRHEISEQEILRYCGPFYNKTETEIRQNLSHLVNTNKERGERDNLSAILIRADK